MKLVFAIIILSSLSAFAKTVDIKVTNKGFEPDKIEAKAGEKLTLNIKRVTKFSCATEIQIPEYKVDQKLPIDELVTVEFTPQKKGEVKFGCAMDMMIGGVILVK